MDPTARTVTLGADFVGIGWDGAARLLDGPGPPPRIDGITVGSWVTDASAPHGGERHDDGDEVLVLVSGAVTVELDPAADGDRPEVISVVPGQAAIVPRGRWHKVHVHEPSHILFLTPGPAFDHRA